MANNFEEIEVINGITWKDLVENPDLLKLDTSYSYELDAEGLIPDVDYPAGTLRLGRCVDPNQGGDNVEYNYDIIILGEYENTTSSVNYTVYDESGNDVVVDINKGIENGTIVFALFSYDFDENVTRLVKATDTVSHVLNYTWLPVTTELNWHIPK